MNFGQAVLQLLSTVGEEETQLLPFFPPISLFTQSIEGGVLFSLITLAAVIFESQLGGSAGSLTFEVVNPNSVSHSN